MAIRGLILVLFASFVVACHGEALFSKLPRTLTIDVNSTKGDLNAGEGKITVAWALNGTDVDQSNYVKVAIKLCYKKISQTDRPWRKTSDELFKDKTCQHAVATQKYAAAGNTTTYTVLKDVPTAHYFVRAYVLDNTTAKVAYGQNMDVDLSIIAITGRHASIDVAAGVFSAFSVLSLAFFFYLEKKKAKSAA